MSRPLKVVALSGGTWRPSRTLVLTQALLAELTGQLPIESKLIELGDIARPWARPCPARNWRRKSKPSCRPSKAPTC